jgi:hypothetical protein
MVSLWMEVLVLLLLAFGVGLGAAWLVWGAKRSGEN